MVDLLIVTMIKGSFLDPEDLFLICPRPLTLSEDQLIRLSLFPFNMITLGLPSWEQLGKTDYLMRAVSFCN